MGYTCHSARRKNCYEDWTRTKDLWKAVMLSVPCSMIKVSAADVWVEAYNRRQQVMQEHESLARTGLQQTMEIMQFKVLLEARLPGKKLNASQLAQELKGMGLQQVQGGRVEDDGLSAFTCQAAMNVHSRLLNNGSIVEAIMLLEHRYGTKNCLFHLAKLDALAMKASNAATRLWSVLCLVDQVCHGLLQNDQVSKAHLKGDRTHCGLVSLFELKYHAPWPSIFPKYPQNKPAHYWLHCSRFVSTYFLPARKLQSRCCPISWIL